MINDLVTKVVGILIFSNIRLLVIFKLSIIDEAIICKVLEYDDLKSMSTSQVFLALSLKCRSSLTIIVRKVIALLLFISTVVVHNKQIDFAKVRVLVALVIEEK